MGMADATPSLHHVVFCVRRVNQDETAAFWRDLGFEFVDIDLPDVGLRVLLDWDRGIEIIAPTEGAGEAAAPFVQFLDEHGEGVYSVVVRTADVSAPISIAARYGATVEYQQHRDDGGHSLDEASLSPMHGMRLTFLATDRPG
jgi:4-hydroxyphenylpyruvate dioxygenase-like putative hemolysin